MKKLNKEGKLVIVNLQATPLDEYCSIRCFCKTDDFARALMKEMGLENFNTTFDAKKLKKIDTNNKCIIFLKRAKFIPLQQENKSTKPKIEPKIIPC